MATAVQIKTSIDTNITNKTLPGSINNTLVGADIKSVIDYVDQEIDTITPIQKTIKRTLTSAEILNLFTTPIELVPAITGKLLVPQFLHQKYNHNTAAYTTSGLFRLGLGTISFVPINFTPIVISADNAQGLTNFTINQSTSGLTYANLPIVVGATTANPASGDGTLDLYLTYLEITL